ncbi:MAG: hypothetical protein RLZZ453_148 [Chlamydiota bacterium]|jgi:hypothetical protein
MKIKETEAFVLCRLGKSSTEHRVTLTPIDSKVKKAALFCFGYLARFLDACLRYVLNTHTLSHFALESKIGMSIEVVSRDRKKEKRDFCFKALGCAALGALVLGGAWMAARGVVKEPVVDHLKRFAASGVSSSIEQINKFKQKEIKNLFFLTPWLVPLIVTGGARIRQNYKENKATFDGWKQNFSYHSLYQLFLVGLAVKANSVMLSVQKSIGWGGFDPSGHIMIKVISAALLLAQLKQKDQPVKLKSKALMCYVAAYVATDAIFLHRTISKYHTAAESIAGLAYGMSLVLLAKQMTHLIQRSFSRTASA